MDRLLKAFDRQDFDSIDKSRWNHVYFVSWTEPNGNAGSAWIQTKLQLKLVLERLKQYHGVDASVETHMIPRDKALQVPWLNRQGVKLRDPVHTISVVQGAGSAPEA